MAENVFEMIGNLGVVPVVIIDNAADAIPLCKALEEGGLPIAEITFRTAAAEDAIRTVSSQMPSMLVGAGTVLTTEQASRAIKAGARFIVSPGLNPAVVEFCQENDVPIIPGCSSPTDIEAALGLGLNVVKFFPAEASGGIKALKAISGPYPMMKFMPTGGVDASNFSNYLSFNKVVACGGTWMVKPDMIKAGDFAGITRLTQETISTMLGFDLAHIGMNTDSDNEALSFSRVVGSVLGMPVKEGSSSNFVGNIFEIMKGNGLGKNGHIAISTNSISRAISYLERKNIALDMTTAKGPDGDPITSVYLKDTFNGFAIHLLQK